MTEPASRCNCRSSASVCRIWGAGRFAFFFVIKEKIFIGYNFRFFRASLLVYGHAFSFRASPACLVTFGRAVCTQKTEFPPSAAGGGLSCFSFADGSLKRHQASQPVSGAEGFHLFESAGEFVARTATDKVPPSD